MSFVLLLAAFLGLYTPSYPQVMLTTRSIGSGFSLAGQDQAENQATSVMTIQTANGVNTTSGWGILGYCEGDYPTGQLPGGGTITDTASDSFTISSNQVQGGSNSMQMQTFYATSITAQTANKVNCNFAGSTHFNTGIKVFYFARTSGSWAHAVAAGSSSAVSATAGTLGTNVVTSTGPLVTMSCINNGGFGADTFSAGTIGGTAATLGTTTLSMNTGIIGCQYAIISGSLSSADAIENLSSTQTLATVFDSLK